MCSFNLGRLFLVSLLFVVLLALQTQASETDQGQPAKTASLKLSCFSVQPEKGAIGKKIEGLPSCDELCGKKGAACTAVQSAINPPPSCGDHITDNYGSCRCCEVKP